MCIRDSFQPEACLRAAPNVERLRYNIGLSRIRLPCSTSQNNYMPAGPTGKSWIFGPKPRPRRLQSRHAERAKGPSLCLDISAG
eukprot:14774-Alexandrium_andersonii.AAC.1